MIQYIFKRILIFIPTLIAISLLAFVISVNSPADPVEQLSRSASQEGGIDDRSAAENRVKTEIRKKLGLDLPLFYLSISTLSDVDTLAHIIDPGVQNTFKRLCRKFGNAAAVQNYFHQIENTKINLIPEGDDVQLMLMNDMKFTVNSLKEISNEQTIIAILNDLHIKAKQINTPTQLTISALEKSYSNIQINKQKWKSFIPKLAFHGLNNQYHLWLFGDLGIQEKRGRKGAIRGDFGNSFADNQAITKKIADKFWYSFILVILSIFLAYLISIPLGVYGAYKKEGRFDKISSLVVFMLYSLPSYFVGTLLLYYFANPDHFVWFPIGGVKDPSVFQDEWSFWQKIKHQSPFFVLPLITYTYSSFAFISRMMRTSMLDVLQQDYIRTARAKGMTEFRVIWVHALRNALLPIVTMIANIFPAALGGSVILESIFSIPGLGLEIYHAVMSTDIPMIVAIFSLTGLLTVIGYLVSDICYALVDPRISYKND